MSKVQTYLDAKFKSDEMSATFRAYATRKYSRYGFPRARAIAYNPEWSPERSRDRYRWVENASCGLRHVGASHDLIRVNHTGWFLDDFQDETVHGEVYQLPARGREPRYVPAVNDPNNDDCAVVDFHSVTSDKDECARWADSMAESYAEREREDREKEQRAQRVADIDEEIQEAYQSFRAIARELREHCDAISGVAVVRVLVRERWLRTKERIHALRAEREELA